MTIKLSQCVNCGNKDLMNILETMEIEEKGKKCLIEKIPAQKCSQCGEIYIDSAASKYIDKQIELFRVKEGI
jgi:YgiT-type zinc finger domain-containing protein